jgi:alpha-D-ribose 1-methylphosphonate 5-triphosphate synthase subunit PhnH
MTHDLSSVVGGFAHEAFGSQAVFRSALQALSHPGRCIAVAPDAELPRRGNAAAAAFFLSMLDADCSLWLSPTLRGSDTDMWLRFHTGCQVVEHAEQAQFIWVDASDALPSLQSFRQGSDEFPDHSATCVVDVRLLSSSQDAEAAADAQHWALTGPGIREEAHLSVTGLPKDFVAQWALNHAGFPCGVDLFLATREQLVGLPRTTRIQSLTEV